MKIQFIKRWGCANFGRIHPDFYDKDSIINVVKTSKGFNPEIHIDTFMAGVAIKSGYAQELKEQIVEKAVYENKMIVPEENKKVIKAETPKEKRNRKDREKRLLKKKK